MDRAKFLAKLQSSAVKLVPLTISGWDEPVYLKPQTMADIKETLSEGTEGTLAERMSKDSYYIERGLAKIIRDKSGERLFDPKDDRQMEELRAALDVNSAEVNRQIQEAYAALMEPDASEIDPKTKTTAKPLGN